jgi:signal transduction histidine kinase
MSDFSPGRIGLVQGAESRRLPYAVLLPLTTLLVCAGYYLGGAVGIALRFPFSPSGTIWPHTPILLAALLLTPMRTWWVYLLAVIPTHLYLVTNFQPGLPLVRVLWQAFGNIIQAVIAAAAVRRFAGAPPRFDNLQSLTAFILLAAIAAPCVVSALHASLFVLTGWASDFWIPWRLRFLAFVFPTLTITPLIVLTVTSGIGAARELPLRRCVEFGLLAIGFFAVGIPVFGLDVAGPRSYPALLYTPLPFLLWAAVRFGLGGVCLSLLIVAFLSLSNAIAGRGPFITQSPAENVLSLQLFLTVISLPLLILAVLIEERQRTEEALRESYRQIQDLAGRLITAQEAEHSRIARELHDDISQQLAALSIALSGLKRRLPSEGAEAQQEVARLQQQTIALSEAIRHLSHELHPGVLQHAGLVATLQGDCAAFGNQHGIDVTFHADAGLEEIPADVALCLYRVAQEALRNIAWHAGARRAEVALTRSDDILELRITDDGQGFDLAAARRRGGLGLISIDERVRLVQGRVRIVTEPRRGTELRVRVPLHAGAGTPLEEEDAYV